jgi:hypothetical protein
MTTLNPEYSSVVATELDAAAVGLHSGYHADTRNLQCSRCDYPLECLEQNRRSGSWLGSLICPNCRSEYFYAYRWRRLTRKS